MSYHVSGFGASSLVPPPKPPPKGMAWVKVDDEWVLRKSTAATSTSGGFPSAPPKSSKPFDPFALITGGGPKGGGGAGADTSMVTGGGEAVPGYPALVEEPAWKRYLPALIGGALLIGVGAMIIRARKKK